MTLLEQMPRETFHEASIPVLETKRLCLARAASWGR